MKTKMTLRQLRTLLPSTKGVTAPSENWFRENPSEIFCSEQVGNAVLTIYHNGFCTYSKRNRICIFRVDGSNGIKYDRDKLFTDTADISEEMLLDKPFLGTLTYIGDMQWDDNADRREENMRKLLIDGDEEQWRGLSEFTSPSVEEELDAQEELEKQAETIGKLCKLVSELSETQRKIVISKFVKNMNQKEIAKSLHITQSTVSVTLNRALANLKSLL